jgi:hypothetical protein
MIKMIRRRGATLIIPNYSLICKQAIKEFLPSAGKYILSRVQGKIGTYQPGWSPLAESTLKRKARSLRRGRGRRMRRQARMGWGPDTPLLDTGEMLRSTRYDIKGNQVIVSADFPMGQHEQDVEVADFGIAGNMMPARPVMGPALMESLDPLADQLESFMSNRL